MKFLFLKLFRFLNLVKNNIAFYPTLLALCGLAFALIMMYLEDLGVSAYLIENIPVLVVDNGNTAMTILSVCISGLISIMVFSFSMVMLLLNQASTNYSPRLLPGLISDQNHQVILGIYLASILYCIFILFSVQPTGDEYQVPGFSVLLGIVLTVVCLCAFIFFIHDISKSIQINHILDNVFLAAKKNLDQIMQNEREAELSFPDSKDWYVYYAKKTGYYQSITLDSLLAICVESDTKLHILPVKGEFVLHGIPIFRTKKELDEETIDAILSNLHFSREEYVSDNYVLGFKQVTEIIVKAMSPAINDPGTALNGIDYLTELFALRMCKKDQSIITEEGVAYIKLTIVEFEELIYNVLASIRTYCKHDIVLVQKLSKMLVYLKEQQYIDEQYIDIINKEAKTLLEDAKSAVTNKIDSEVILNMAKRLEVKFDVSNLLPSSR